MVALVVAGMAVRATEHPLQRHFLTSIAPDYKIPGKNRIWNLIKEIDAELTGKVDQVLSSPNSGPWFLTSDGASSKMEALLTVDARDPKGQCFHLALLNASYHKQDAAQPKVHLKSQTDRLAPGRLAAIAQDTAPVCRKAFKLLRDDLHAAGHRRMAYLNCGEHVAQLAHQDLVKLIPWCKADAFSGVRKRTLGRYHAVPVSMLTHTAEYTLGMQL